MKLLEEPLPPVCGGDASQLGVKSWWIHLLWLGNEEEFMGRDLHDSTSSVLYGRRSLSPSERCGLSAHREIPCPAPLPLLSVRNCTVSLLYLCLCSVFSCGACRGDSLLWTAVDTGFHCLFCVCWAVKRNKDAETLTFPPSSVVSDSSAAMSTVWVSSLQIIWDFLSLWG